MTADPRRSLRHPPLELVGLFLVFAASAGLALWQASNHLSPTIFTDELEMTTLSRSIAATGHATLRGAPAGTAPLAAYLSAPLWWINDVPTAYELVKALGAILMASAVFPAYGLARLAVRPLWALFAAAGTGFAPALAYAPILVKEPTAYPAAALALFLIARWAAAPGWKRFVLALLACPLGYATRDELAVLFAVLGITVLLVLWDTPLARALRAGWTGADWIGGCVLLVGAVVVLNALIAHRSTSWYTATTFFKDRMLDYGLWAAGALTIGLGVLPVIACLASLVRPRGEERRPGVQALRRVTVVAIGTFGLYTAVKAAYLSTQFATLTLERNLIYLTPLLLAGTALFLQRQGGRWWAVLAAGAFAVYLVKGTPYSLEQYPNFETHGVAIAAFANRIFHWPTDTIRHALVDLTVGGTIILAALPRLRTLRVGPGVAGALAAAVLVWTGTTEVYAAHGESIFSKQLYASLPKPVNWLDLETGTRPTVFLGRSVADANPINLLEFWNRSIRGVWSVDGNAPGPGATVTPDLIRPDGTLTQPGTEFVVTVPGVDIVGERIGSTVAGNQLVRLPNRQLRLRNAESGIAPDGWMAGSASYAQYAVQPGSHGIVHLTLSRTAWCGKDKRSVITIRLGTVAVSPTKEPTIGKLLQERTGVIHSCQVKTFELPTPDKPWLLDVTIDPTFSPKELDPSLSDPRQLGAKPSLDYLPGG